MTWVGRTDPGSVGVRRPRPCPRDPGVGGRNRLCLQELLGEGSWPCLGELGVYEALGARSGGPFAALERLM